MFATHTYATAGTINGIRETAETKRAYWTPIIGSNYPQRFAIPDLSVRDGEHLSIDGIELVVDDFGPTECSDNTAIELPQIEAVIISDLVYNRVHPWLAEGRFDLWLKALAKANRCFAWAKVLYAGHGAAGSPAIINEQAAYINAVREIVASAVKDDPIVRRQPGCHPTEGPGGLQGLATRNDYRYEYDQPRGRDQIASIDAGTGR